MLAAKARADDQEQLKAMFETGKVTPSIGTNYPLRRAPEAMHRLEAGAVSGQAAITI